MTTLIIKTGGREIARYTTAPGKVFHIDDTADEVAIDVYPFMATNKPRVIEDPICNVCGGPHGDCGKEKCENCGSIVEAVDRDSFCEDCSNPPRSPLTLASLKAAVASLPVVPPLHNVADTHCVECGCILDPRAKEHTICGDCLMYTPTTGRNMSPTKAAELYRRTPAPFTQDKMYPRVSHQFIGEGLLVTEPNEVDSPFYYFSNHKTGAVFKHSVITWDEKDVACVPEGQYFKEAVVIPWSSVLRTLGLT